MAEARFRKCDACGRMSSQWMRSCMQCGAPLDMNAPTVALGAPAVEEPRPLRAGTTRFTRVSDDRKHYMIAEAQEPIPLEPGKPFAIGRAQRANLRVHTAQVSRRHCEISWIGDPPMPFLVEQRSSYGTFVAGKQLASGVPEQLHDGDEIRLGPTYVVIYRHCTEQQLRDEMKTLSAASTDRLKLPAPGSFHLATQEPATPASSLARPTLAPRAASLSTGAAAPRPSSLIPERGNFETVSAFALLEQLRHERRTGVLKVFDRSGRGELTLVDGRATKVVFGELAGKAALARLARLTAGPYQFEATAPPPGKPSPPEPPRQDESVTQATASSAAPSVPSPEPSGVSPEEFIETARAAGLVGFELGSVVGAAVAALLDQNELVAALDLADAGVALAEVDGPPELARDMKTALASSACTPARMERLAGLLEESAATEGPPGPAKALAARALALFAPGEPPPEDASSPLSKLAAIASAP